MGNYYKVMLGRKSVYAAQGYQDGFIGVDYKIRQDLTGELTEDWRDFNKKFVPVYLSGHPDKTRIAAGLACGALWTVCKEIQVGDVVLSPSGEAGKIMVGDVTGAYEYHPGQVLPHRRPVKWRPEMIQRDAMSEALQNSSGRVGAVINLGKYKEELASLSSGQPQPTVIVENEIVENLAAFQLEKQLEGFLVDNWASTELGQKYDIYTDEDGAKVGQQFKTDTGPLDILAISKDRSELLVVELKRGRVSDVVVGQIQRYMGYVLDELAAPHQTVKGAIIALEDDIQIRRALRVTQGISFYTYQISFKLNAVTGAGQ